MQNGVPASPSFADQNVPELVQVGPEPSPDNRSRWTQQKGHFCCVEICVDFTELTPVTPGLRVIIGTATEH